MTESTRAKRKRDWRNLPRKSAEQKKSHWLSFRVTEGQWQAIKQRAAAAGLTLVDYVIGRAIH